MATEWFPPGCRARKCMLHLTYDMVNMRRVWQHGNNPEAVLLLDDHEIIRIERQRPLTWDETVHMVVAEKLLE